MFELLFPALVGIGGFIAGILLKDRLFPQKYYYEYIKIPTQNEVLALTFDEQKGILLEVTSFENMDKENMREGKMPLLRKGDTNVKLGTYIIKQKDEKTGETIRKWELSFPIVFRYKDTIIDPSLIDCLKDISLILEKYERGEIEIDTKTKRALEDIREKLDILVKLYSKYSDIKVAFKSVENRLREYFMKQYYAMTSELERIIRQMLPLVPWFIGGIVFAVIMIFAIGNVQDIHKENSELKAKLYWYQTHYAGPPPPWVAQQKAKETTTPQTTVPISNKNEIKEVQKTKPKRNIKVGLDINTK